ncbi:MAG: nitroreductase [Clostridia bacterium]|nr:nitroreductase [Clostridia bacterium]
MDAYDNLLNRRSCRAYTDEMPSEELIGRVLKAGTYAATGRGKQSPVIIAVTDKAMRDRLSAMNAAVMGTRADPFYGAPVVLIVLADRGIPTYLYDGSCVMQQLMLAANEAGLGSCWIHRAREEFNSDEGKQILKDLGIEGDYEGIGHCVLGFAAGKAREPLPRKDNYIYWIR